MRQRDKDERIGKDLVAASATPLLLAILQKGPSYGYAIIQDAEERRQWDVVSAALTKAWRPA